MAKSSKSKPVKQNRNRHRGVEFERLIANKMRVIYDDPELTAKVVEAAANGDQVTHRALQKTSAVRRSDQGKGATEPDLVIQGCPIWHELHRGSSTWAEKFDQAERDVAAIESPLWPVAITCSKGKRDYLVTMRIKTLLALEDLVVPADAPEFYAETIVHLGLDAYLAILRSDYERRRRSAATT